MGVKWVCDMINSDDNVLTIEDFKEKYFTPQITDFYGLRNATVEKWPQIKNTINISPRPILPKELKIIFKDKKGSQDM